ncbi:MAG: hypothetical protein DHS20C11_05520 [Lysobacteraceae bacterium]|nr:MAG: hypothetical protein DHS20C11_05520 [Xanthomonadaceae bacterium]
MPAQLSLEQRNLPKDAAERSRLLQRYFQRQDVDARRTDQGWAVQTDWTANAEYYIDPELSSGLDMWPTPLATKSIPLAVQQEKDFLLGLNDCWSLLGWSLKLAERPDTQRINLIHLDSHTDLGSPRVGLTADSRWVDLLSGDAFDIGDPMSVANAIKSGAIGIGSFICPLIASGVEVDLYHLSPRQHFRYSPDRYSLALGLERNDPIFPSAIRPFLEVGREECASNYVLTDKLAEICQAIDRRFPTFLHIDLDYFNNRFDGRPDWRGKQSRHDPSVTEVLDNIDKVFAELKAREIPIADLCVGVSPGFFPAEYWHPALQQIRKQAQGL